MPDCQAATGTADCDKPQVTPGLEATHPQTTRIVMQGPQKPSVPRLASAAPAAALSLTGDSPFIPHPSAFMLSGPLPSVVKQNRHTDLVPAEPPQFSISPQQIRHPHLLSWSLAIGYWSFAYLPYPVPPAIPEITPRVTPRAIPRVTWKAIRGATRRATRTAILRTTRKAILPAIRESTRESIGRAIPRIARGIPRRIARRVIRRAIYRPIGRITRRITRGTPRRVACPAIRRAV